MCLQVCVCGNAWADTELDSFITNVNMVNIYFAKKISTYGNQAV